jgi:hypothetical protein
MALAELCLQRVAVADNDHSVLGRDRATCAHFLDDERDSFLAHSKHVGNQLPSHAQHISFNAVETKQKPSA